MLHETMSRETIALSVINKMKISKHFSIEKANFNSYEEASSATYPNLTKKLKNRIQTSQNKCIRFCLQLDKMTHISHKEFETLNWLPMIEGSTLSINLIVFK